MANPNKYPEGQHSSPRSPSISESLSANEGNDETIEIKEEKQDNINDSLIRRDSSDSDDHVYYDSEGQGQLVEDEFDFVDNTFILCNNDPNSPNKAKRKHKPKRKHKHKKHRRKNRKRKIKHPIFAPPSKKIKQDPKQQISLISDEENDENLANNCNSSLSNISYSVNNSINNKENPIYVSDDNKSDDDDVIYMGQNRPQQIYKDFPSPSPIAHNNSQVDICNLIDNMDLRSLSVVSQYGNMQINIQDGNNSNNSNNSRSNGRRPSPPPLPILDDDNIWHNCNLNPLTKAGLQSSRSISIPTNEMISLVKTVNDHGKHLIYSDIHSQNRLLALAVAMLECTQLHQRNNHNNNNNNMQFRIPQILLISPRKQQAMSARKLLMSVGKFYELNCQSLMGGMPTFDCLQLLRKGIDIITATPGKLCSLIAKRKLNLTGLTGIAFNAADELVSSDSMRSQMRIIIDALPQRKLRVIWCEAMVTPYSAQNSKEIIRNVDKNIDSYNEEEKQISCVNEKENMHPNAQIQKVNHILCKVGCQVHQKKEALYEILRYYKSTQDNIIIYFNTRHRLNDVFFFITKQRKKESMRQGEFFLLDGQANNTRRFSIIADFARNGGIMFCTDLLNDNELNANLIIAYDVPQYNPNETYIKRISSSNTKFIINLVDKFSVVEFENICQYFNIHRIKYQKFSKDRRHHVSHRMKSILNDRL